MKQPKIYVIAYYVKQPMQPTQTRFAGYMKDEANINYQEQVIVTSKVKDRDYATAGTILDAVNKKIIKSTWRPNATFDELWKYFSEHYQNYLKPINDIMGLNVVPSPPSVVPTTPESSGITTSPVSSSISS